MFFIQPQNVLFYTNNTPFRAHPDLHVTSITGFYYFCDIEKNSYEHTYKKRYHPPHEYS